MCGQAPERILRRPAEHAPGCRWRFRHGQVRIATISGFGGGALMWRLLLLRDLACGCVNWPGELGAGLGPLRCAGSGSCCVAHRWPVSCPAAAISATATPLKPPPCCAMRSRSTSASQPPPPGASRKPCANRDSPQPQHIPPPARNLPINAEYRPAAHSRASNKTSYRQMKLHNAASCSATAAQSASPTPAHSGGSSRQRIVTERVIRFAACVT